MSPEVIAALIGLGPASVGTMLQSYQLFKKSNVEMFFGSLVDSGNKDQLKIFGERDDLQRLFFSIVDKVANESNVEKIEKWKNAILHLATDFESFDFKDNFIRSLESLTAFDLTVLFTIYTTEFTSELIEPELTSRMLDKKVPTEILHQSLKALAANNFLHEQYDKTAVFASDDGRPILGSFHYSKNNLGQQFLKFITDKDIVN